MKSFRRARTSLAVGSRSLLVASHHLCPHSALQIVYQLLITMATLRMLAGAQRVGLQRLATSYSLATSTARPLVRTFASPPAVSDASAVTVTPAAATTTAAKGALDAAAPPAATSPPKAALHVEPKPASSSVWQRLTAFVTGVGVASVWFFCSLNEEMKRSSAAIDASLSAFKDDVLAVHADERSRLALLEHEVAALKRK